MPSARKKYQNSYSKVSFSDGRPTGDFSFGGSQTESPNTASNDRSAQYKAQTREQAELNAELTDRAAANAQSRTKDMARFGENIAQNRANQERAANQNTDDKAARLKLENDRERYAFEGSQKDKDRDAGMTAAKMSAVASSAASADTNASQRFANENDNRTQKGEQAASIERAKVAAQSQVTAAIVGNRGSYGGYW